MVRSLYVIVLIQALSISAYAADVPKELVPLQGKWRVTKLTIDGADTFIDLKKNNHSYDFSGETLTMIENGKAQKPMKMVANSATTPATIDIVVPEGKVLGIFKLDGDTLTMCWNPKDRPKDFKAEKGQMSMLFVLEKAK